VVVVEILVGGGGEKSEVLIERVAVREVSGSKQTKSEQRDR
jgi:hypothetical protein